MMVQHYDSGLMTPMLPIVKASQLNTTVTSCEPLPLPAIGLCLTCIGMLLDYLLLVVVPLFFMLGASICNHPVYPGHVFSKTNSSPHRGLYTDNSQNPLSTRFRGLTNGISTAPWLSSGPRV